MSYLYAQKQFYIFSIWPSNWHLINCPYIYVDKTPKRYSNSICRCDKSFNQTQASPDLHPITSDLSATSRFWRNFEITTRLEITSRSLQPLQYIEDLQFETSRTHYQYIERHTLLTQSIHFLTIRSKLRGTSF